MQFDGDTLNRLDSASAFVAYAMDRLCRHADTGDLFSDSASTDPGASAVLFAMGDAVGSNGFEPCLVLNKRSDRVKQPGDLCCPGGSISPRIDRVLSRIIALPGFPLGRWPCWSAWRSHRPLQAGRLAALLATSLRESLEEMRLNPLDVRFIGPMPVQRLVMFRREIFPMAGWIRRQQRFYPNWEVEKIVHVPFRDLLNPSNYVRYRLQVRSTRTDGSLQMPTDFPCFVHRHQDESELLWGATYRMTQTFVERVFGFRPPSLETLPVVEGTLDENYTRVR